MRTLRPGLAFLFVALLAAGCGERVVYVQRDLLHDLPAGAGGFVGYSDEATKLTVCGNCHVTQNNQWRGTAHAGAFALTTAAQNPAICLGCHGVSGIGNDGPDQGGLPATNHARFHDVQCESCHGPGETHVRNPDGGTVSTVLARVNAGLDMPGTCAECHSGFHHPFVEEWALSQHGRVIASPAGRPDCSGCHEGKAALRALGVHGVYEEMNQPGHIAITCAVCHDPHSARFEGQLRFSISVPDEQQNLCMRCHHKRGGPEFTAQNRGPHSPEGPMLLGEAGWWPPNMPIQPGERIVTTHGSQANPRMCAGCHMQQFAVVDPQTQLPMTTTGHLFEALPCLDARGLPTRDACAPQERSFRTCTGAGCHGSEAAARSATTIVRLRIDNLNNQLKSQLARVPASEFDPNDGRYSTAEGARFNSQLADRPGSIVHNPFLLEALLIGSIQQVQRDYGIAPAASVQELEAMMRNVVERMQLVHGE
jgi:predicted CXXCH cytochrome family protein